MSVEKRLQYGANGAWCPIEYARREFIMWEQWCDEFIESLDECNWIKHPQLSISVRQSIITRIAQLKSVKNSMRECFVNAGYNAGWCEIDTAFENRTDYRILIDCGNKLQAHRTSSISRRCELKINTRMCAKYAAKTC